MKSNFANPAPLGLMGFATTTWLLSMHNAGWMPGDTIGAVLVMAFAFGGTAQFFAGILEYPKGNTFGFVAFCSYGAFWWSFALLIKFFAAGAGTYLGWYLIVWGAFSFIMWLGTFGANRALMLVFLALWPTFLLLAFGLLEGNAMLGRLGGYLGLITALLAFYLASAEILKEALGRDVLPVGPYNAQPVLTPAAGAID